MKKKIIIPQGFTIIEMVVTVGIFVLIAGIVLGNFRQGERMDDLKRGTIELEDSLRRVQVLGMSGQIVSVCEGGSNNGKSCVEQSDCPGGECINKVPSGGFGIAIGQIADDNNINCYESAEIECPTTYDLFVDNAGQPGIFDTGDFALPGGEDYALPKEVFIRDYSWICLWTNPEKPGCPAKQNYGLDVTFRPPKPIPYFFTRPDPPIGTAVSEQSIQILIQHETIGKCRAIYINGVSGEVSSVARNNCQIEWYF